MLERGTSLTQAKNLAECVVFANPKGGTGKTTTCLSVAGYLAKSGARVLVVDFDPQASATSGLGIDGMTLKHSVYDAVLKECGRREGVPITQVILEADFENLHVAPSELDLGVAEVLMQHTRDRANTLNRILKEVRHLYDYILIDVPPSSGLLMVNGLCASDKVVVPIEPSIFSLEALNNLLTIFRDIKRMTGHPIKHITVLLVRHIKPRLFSRVSTKRNPSQAVEARLREMFPTVFVIPEAVEIYEAQREGIPISHYAPRSRVGKAYQRVAESVRVNATKKQDVL